MGFEKHSKAREEGTRESAGTRLAAFCADEAGKNERVGRRELWKRGLSSLLAAGLLCVLIPSLFATFIVRHAALGIETTAKEALVLASREAAAGPASDAPRRARLAFNRALVFDGYPAGLLGEPAVHHDGSGDTTLRLDTKIPAGVLVGLPDASLLNVIELPLRASVPWKLGEGRRKAQRNRAD